MQDEGLSFKAVFAEEIKPFANQITSLTNSVQQLNTQNEKIQASLNLLLNRTGEQVASPPANAQKNRNASKQKYGSSTQKSQNNNGVQNSKPFANKNGKGKQRKPSEKKDMAQ